MTSLKKWELGRLAEEQTEARESCEDRLVADPENATISVIGACILSIHGWFEVKTVLEKIVSTGECLNATAIATYGHPSKPCYLGQ